ncbi:glycerophosphocholine phosphodiesterase GPCPD1-like [Anneissia japonica]|uniref:glycerophosphocholine phosphodiesterase GPCPD1-like n=1 Tax=Anneissia japonica TaxID=1529436 RepID=UPI0014255FFE|nr:glycerophosphocholine phosphodiesterase GPCPD1-like [Anneissia japonica]
MVLVNFNIDADITDPNTVVVVSGNCQELGRWLYNGVKSMSRLGDGRWTLEVNLNSVDVGSLIEYRYAICSFPTEKDGQANTIIHKWETHMEPRVLSLKGETVYTDDGCFGHKDGIRSVRGGWLTDQSEVRLMLHSNPFELFIKTKEVTKIGFRVKANHICQRNDECIPTQIKVVNEDEYIAKPQAKNGRHYKNNEIMVFSSQVLELQNTVFVIEVLSFQEHGDVNILGQVAVLGTMLTKTRDDLHCPVTNTSGEVVGVLQVQYVVIKPLPKCSSLCTFQNPYQWTSTRCLSVGHRGMGVSFKNKGLLYESGIRKTAQTFIENTIGAFKGAVEAGADMVEFDVHVCKDHVPVVYHDYNVPVCLQMAEDTGKHLQHRILLTDFSFEELQSVQTTHTAKRNENVKDSDRLFPPLTKVLQNTPIQLAFNVEIKYPLHNVDGTNECPDYSMDMSVLVDNVLQVLIEHAQSRNIIITCFDPDVCTLVCMKQNRFPVMLIHCGPTEKYIKYADPRIATVHSAMHWVLAEQLVGLVGHVDDYVRDESLIKLIHDANLHLFIWGEDNKNPLLVQDMIKKGVEGVVTDDVTVLPQLA